MSVVIIIQSFSIFFFMLFSVHLHVCCVRCYKFDSLLHHFFPIEMELVFPHLVLLGVFAQYMVVEVLTFA